jgi:NAD(P)H-flavin reductase
LFEIVQKELIGPNLYRYEIHAPRVAKAHQCGQFVIVRPQSHSERIPLTVASKDPENGNITLIVQTVGKTTFEMSQMNAGDYFLDVAGPLGQPSHLANYGTVVVIGGGVGTAVIYPQALALKELGNQVVTIIGARTEELLILRDQLGALSDRQILTTNDGSCGIQGFVTDALQQLIDDPDTSVDAVYCSGPVIMMKNIAKVTESHKIPTMVSLNPIMVDGTGMCGGCRVTIGGKVKFACVDGPEFDGHQVDYDELMDRLTMYQGQERQSLDKYEKNHKCKLGG